MGKKKNDLEVEKAALEAFGGHILVVYKSDFRKWNVCLKCSGYRMTSGLAKAGDEPVGFALFDSPGALRGEVFKENGPCSSELFVVRSEDYDDQDASSFEKWFQKERVSVGLPALRYP